MMAKQIGMKPSDPKYARQTLFFRIHQSVFKMQTQWASPIYPLFWIDITCQYNLLLMVEMN